MFSKKNTFKNVVDNEHNRKIDIAVEEETVIEEQKQNISTANVCRFIIEPMKWDICVELFAHSIDINRHKRIHLIIYSQSSERTGRGQNRFDLAYPCAIQPSILIQRPMKTSSRRQRRCGGNDSY